MKQFAGISILLAVILTAYLLFQGNHHSGVPAPAIGAAEKTSSSAAVQIKGFIGGEKSKLLKDPDVVRILHDRYSLELTVDRRGSLEMVREAVPTGTDFLWPSSQVALDIYKSSGKPLLRGETLLNSPLVIYSWKPITEVLSKKGIVKQQGGTYYIVNLPELVRIIKAEQTWKQNGLPQLYGQVVLYSTDPVLSNSGNMFAGLLANILNKGEVVTEESLPKVLPTVKKLFDAQGYMEQSSDVIFQEFLNRGMGDKPLLVGYEAQMIEYSLENEERFAQRKQEVRTLYPQPTVWSNHPLIALTPNGAKLIDALQDEEIQRLAWEHHGFRPVTTSHREMNAVAVPGIPQAIENVMPMPRSRVMEKLLKGLQ